MNKDTQRLELVGQHRLASELLLAGLEVAFPARDRGVDLIAYIDIDKVGGRFIAKPIQMKAASQRSFGIWEKYAKINDLIFAFVWHVDGASPPETYALTYEESEAISTTMGWNKKPTWITKGRWDNTNPGKRICELLEPHLMTPEKWWEKITGKPR